MTPNIPGRIFYSDALESKYRALSVSLRAQADGYEKSAFQREFGRMERSALKTAEPYFWSSNIATAVADSSRGLPGSTAIQLERFPASGWFWFDRAVPLEGFEPFQGLLWARSLWGGVDGEEGGLVVGLYGDPGGGLQVQDSVTLLRNVSIDEAHRTAGLALADDRYLSYTQSGTTSAQTDSRPVMRFFLAAQFWIAQSVVSSSRLQPDRSTRRRLSRAGYEPSDVQVITLRRRAGDSHNAGNEGPVEWSCRWIVRGHWRQQYHRSTGERVPTFILPYVKGPDDAPLKAPRPAVFAVTR